MSTQGNINYFEVSAPGANCGYEWKVYCYYENGNGQYSEVDCNVTGAAGNNKFVPLDGLGIPDGANIYIYIDVVGGSNQTGTQIFTYTEGASANDNCASYTTSGSTLINTLTYNGLVSYSG